jgi:hypothetical protein
MSLTEDYGRVHEAFLATAAHESITPSDVRLLVALLERGGTGDSFEVQQETYMNPTQVRRSSLNLRHRGLIHATSPDGGETRPGQRVQMELTAAGEGAAARTIGISQPVAP